MREFSSATFLLLSLLLFAAFLPGAAFGENGVSVQVVETEGSAPVIDKDVARARSEAVRNAMQKAVELVAGRWISPQDAARKAKTLAEKIYNQAEGFIQDFRILSEISAPDVYTVTVRSTVFAESIRADLQGIGVINSAALKRPVSRISLKVQGIRDYGDYARLRGILNEQIRGIREATPSEASWGMVRFEIAAEGSAESIAARLREKMAFDLRHQDPRFLEVNLR